VELEKANYSWEKEYELIQEKYREPIDFNQFTLQGEVVEDQLVIKIVNPAHPPVNPVEAKSITAGIMPAASYRYVTRLLLSSSFLLILIPNRTALSTAAIASLILFTSFSHIKNV